MNLLSGLMKRRKRRGRERDGKNLRHWLLLQRNHTAKAAIIDERSSVSIIEWEAPDSKFWEEHLTATEYQALREKGTEAPKSHTYNNFFPKTGYFACRACGLPLYSYKAKFNSSSGWPSFGEFVEGHVDTRLDYSLGCKRVELCCNRCKSHLGHVFVEENVSKLDRTKVYQERHCVNGICLKYIKSPLPSKYIPTAHVLGRSISRLEASSEPFDRSEAK